MGLSGHNPVVNWGRSVLSAYVELHDAKKINDWLVADYISGFLCQKLYEFPAFQGHKTTLTPRHVLRVPGLLWNP